MKKVIILLDASSNTTPKLVYNNARMKVKFNKYLVKQNNVTYNHGPIVNTYIVYKLSPVSISTTLQRCLFGVVKVTSNSDLNKYKYSGYDIGFDALGNYTQPSRGYVTNIIIFGADMSNSVHATNKTRRILILGRDFIQGLGGTIFTEKMYSINFTENNKKFCLSLHYNGDSN